MLFSASLPKRLGIDAALESPVGIGSCEAKLTGQKVSVKISEGHPLASCLVRTTVASGRLPLRLTDVLLNEAAGVRLRYLGEAGAVVSGTAVFAMEIVLTTDLPEGSKLQNVGFELSFIPEYLSQ